MCPLATIVDDVNDEGGIAHDKRRIQTGHQYIAVESEDFNEGQIET
jgi:hypothetical protein